MPEFTDLAIPKANNPAGTKLLLSIAALSDFTTIAVPAAVPATLAETNVISTDHDFATGKKFWKLELELNKNELNAEIMGAVTGAARKHTYTGFMSGLSAAQVGWLEKAQNQKLLIMAHLSDGQVIQLGEEDNGAMLQSNFQTGVSDGGERGWPVTITWYGRTMLYTGVISYTPAV
jgi:hypothetical protein